MDRCRTSPVLLLLFGLCAGIALGLSGSPAGPDQGLAPAQVQFLGYALGLVGGLLLLGLATAGGAR